MILKIYCKDCKELLAKFVRDNPKREIDIIENGVHACFHALNKKFQIIKVLGWMLDDMTKRFDEQRSHFGMEVSGGYSPELTEAIELLESMKREVNETKGN